MRHKRHGERRRRCGAVVVAGGLFGALASSVALADEPPPARCFGSGAAQPFGVQSRGEPTGLAVATNGDRIGIAVQTSSRARRGVTEVQAVVLPRDGAESVATRTVATTSGRRSGTLAAILIDSAPGGLVVVATLGQVVHVLQVGHADASDRLVQLRAPVRRMQLAPLVVARSDGIVSLLWREAGAVHVQDVVIRRGATPSRPRSPAAPGQRLAFASSLAPRIVLAPVRPGVVPLEVVAGSARTIRLPHGAVAVSAAAGPSDSTGVVLRTEGRHYVIAVIDSQGTAHYPRNAPAGCERGRCQPVEIVSAPGGFVAGWTEPPTRDGLRSPGARALDAAGHVRWSEPSFIPMARGVPIAGPDGQALALQLGLPIVLRGGVRPVAVPAGVSTVDAQHAYPLLARAWIEGPRSEGSAAHHELGVAWVTAHGTGFVARLRCGGP